MKTLKGIKDSVLNWLIIRYYTFKGWRMSKKFIEGKTYKNTLANTYGIYRGNNTFYETKTCVVPEAGTIFYDSRDRKYTNLQIGLFELWIPADVEVDTSNDGPTINNWMPGDKPHINWDE